MKIKLGGKFWDVDDSLPFEKVVEMVNKIKFDYWQRGIDPLELIPEDLVDYRRRRQEILDAEDGKPPRKA
jgi:hypothetical protein